MFILFQNSKIKLLPIGLICHKKTDSLVMLIYVPECYFYYFITNYSQNIFFKDYVSKLSVVYFNINFAIELLI